MSVVGILFFMITMASASPTCANLLASGGYKTVMRQAALMQVVGDETPIPLEALYLKLKEAEWAAGQGPLIKAPELNERDSLQFYRNHLRSLYLRVADMWRLQEVRMQVGPVMKPELEEILTKMLADSIRPWSMEDADLTPERAREHLRERAWMAWPWGKIAGFVSDYLERDQDFGKYWDEKSDLPFEFYSRIKIAIERRKPTVCCMSEPGCRTCPHNRGFRP